MSWSFRISIITQAWCCPHNGDLFFMVSETRKSKIKVFVKSPANPGQIAKCRASILAFSLFLSASPIPVAKSWFLSHLSWVYLRPNSTEWCGVLGYLFLIKGSLPANLTRLVVEAYLGKFFLCWHDSEVLIKFLIVSNF